MVYIKNLLFVTFKDGKKCKCAAKLRQKVAGKKQVVKFGREGNLFSNSTVDSC